MVDAEMTDTAPIPCSRARGPAASAENPRQVWHVHAFRIAETIRRHHRTGRLMTHDGI
jgi:hypothetical protein